MIRESAAGSKTDERRKHILHVEADSERVEERMELMAQEDAASGGESIDRLFRIQTKDVTIDLYIRGQCVVVSSPRTGWKYVFSVLRDEMHSATCAIRAPRDNASPLSRTTTLS